MEGNTKHASGVKQFIFPLLHIG